MSKHVGLDLGSKYTHVAVATSIDDMRVTRVPTAELGEFLSKLSPSRVVMEACTQSRHVARLAIAAGHTAVIVPGMHVRALGVGARGIKTDAKDAEVLVRASLRNESLPSAYLRSDASEERKRLFKMRMLLVAARRSISLAVRAWLRSHLITIDGRANTPHFVEVVKNAAERAKLDLPYDIKIALANHEFHCAQIEELDAKIEAFVESDPVCQGLMEMPGVGPQITYALTAYVDDPHRFRSADELASWLALVPGEGTTGGKIRRTGTIVAGPKELKSVLIQGAWSMMRCAPNDPLVVWGKRIAEKKNSRVAVVAMARKTATILWSMWKHGTKYDPSRASIARAQSPTLPLVTTLTVAASSANARTPRVASTRSRAKRTPKTSTSASTR